MPKDAIDKVQALGAVLERLHTPAKDNPSPHTLDTQTVFVNALNTIKENLNDLKYYAEDFGKRNAVGKQFQAKKIKEKVNVRLDSIATHTMLLDNMAQAHNQALQSQATHSQNRSDCQPDMKIAEAYGRESELRSTL